MKKNLKMLWVAMFCCSLANFAGADLLGVNPSYPLINFVSTDPTAVSYDPVSQIFSVDALPAGIEFSEQDSGTLFVTNRSIQIQLDTDGNLVSGVNGFVLTGQFTHVVAGVTNNYSGVLLQGDVFAFGYLYSGPVNQFDFRINVTGGELKSLFDCASDLGVTMTSEDSTFTGTFTNAFNGTAKGYCSPDDTNPPSITCPPLSQVVTTPTIDPNTGNPGFVITYPNPVVIDNCDPEPTLYCDTPSGSIVDLNPGDQLTVTCYGIDVSGNYSYCSFTVTMGVTNGPCTLAFEGPGCTPTTLPTDLGLCSATYTFSLPVATNCSGQFTATATALSEAGNAITLTPLTNGMLQGSFPRTLTTNGDIITFTASDGQGGTVVQQCQVFVKDTQPPTITCMDQTATFKPILTNALSCISANFNNNCIVASNYIWFSSVIQASSCQNRGGVFTVHISDQTIQLAVDNTNITLSVPDAYVYFSNGVATATTIFTNGQWITDSSLNFPGNTFASGLAWQVPFNIQNQLGNCWGRDNYEPFRRHVNSATWCARFAVNTNNVALQWQWGAVAETKLTTNCNTLCTCVKPIDNNSGSCWNNSDPAGSCENYKPYLVGGACGQGICQQGWGWNQSYYYDCTGTLSPIEPCNLGKGIVCEGAVYFATPVASDNCGNSVQVTCNPPSGTVFGPGEQLITCTAVDSSGNSNQCSFTLTVLAPVQVVFDSPACDNFADNTAQPDAGYTDFNCPDDPSTPEQVTCFHVGNCVYHQVRLLDCNGNDVTASLTPCVTVHIDVTERSGSYANSCLVTNLVKSYSGAGCPGSVMVPCNGTFQYNLNTAGYPARTVNTSTFFRSCVWVDYNSSPGMPVGMEDVLLQSQ
jgi:hypothetical protein